MSQIWIWTVPVGQSLPGSEPGGLADDLTGYRVDATDGHIGKVDAATYEEGSGSMIVDTGLWIFGKKRVIPGGLVTSIDHEGRTIHLACTKTQVEGAPDYDTARANEQTYRDEIGEYFAPSQYAGMTGDPNGPTAGTAHV